MRPWWVGAAAISVAITGCGSTAATPRADDPVFSGLDTEVVTEVLGNPRAQDNVRILPSVERPSMWQGMVSNFVLCRQMLSLYETWRDTGAVPPVFPSPDAPTHPESSFADIQRTYDFFQTEVSSGEIARLRADLVNEAGCGAWVPASPNDPSGPTVAERVRSSG